MSQGLFQRNPIKYKIFKIFAAGIYVSSLSFEIICIQKTECARSLSYRSKTFQRGSQCGSLKREGSKMKEFNSLRIYISLLSNNGCAQERKHEK